VSCTTTKADGGTPAAKTIGNRARERPTFATAIWPVMAVQISRHDARGASVGCSLFDGLGLTPDASRRLTALRSRHSRRCAVLGGAERSAERSKLRAEAGPLTGGPDPTRSAARGAEREHRNPAGRCGAVGPAGPPSCAEAVAVVTARRAGTLPCGRRSP